MIAGIGSDLCQISRITESLERWGYRFEKKVFTPAESEYCRSRRTPDTHFASRFAAKEAALKALGTGISQGIGWKDVEVTRQRGEAPQLVFYRKAAELIRERGIHASHLTLSHDGDYALAVVILEKPD